MWEKLIRFPLVRLPITLLGICTFTVSCAVITSESLESRNRMEDSIFNRGDTLKRNQHKGMIYYLPQRLMKVTATRTPTPKKTLASAKTALANAEKGSRESTEKLNAAKAAVKSATAELKAARDTSEIPPAVITKKQNELGEAQVELAMAKQAFEISQTALTAALLNVENNTEEIESKFELKLELLAAEPDPYFAFYVRPRHQTPLRDDVTKIEIDERGLLKSSHVESTDRTADILVEIAGAIGAFITGPTPRFYQQGRPLDTSCPIPEGKLNYEKIFNPIESVDIDKVNSVLEPCFNRTLWVTPIDGDSGSRLNVSSRVSRSRHIGYDSVGAGEKYSGYIYRASLPYTIGIDRIGTVSNATSNTDGEPENDTQEAINNSDSTLGRLEQQLVEQVRQNLEAIKPRVVTEQSLIVMLPNEGPIAYIPIKSSVFVKTINDVSFKDGAVISWDRNRPSELLEVVRLPVRLLKAFVSVPADLIKLRVNLDTEQKNLFEAQQAQIKAEESLRELQDCIEQLEKTGTASAEC